MMFRGSNSNNNNSSSSSGSNDGSSSSSSVQQCSWLEHTGVGVGEASSEQRQHSSTHSLPASLSWGSPGSRVCIGMCEGRQAARAGCERGEERERGRRGERGSEVRATREGGEGERMSGEAPGAARADTQPRVNTTPMNMDTLIANRRHPRPHTSPPSLPRHSLHVS